MNTIRSYARYIGIWILREILNLLNVFPVKKNRVLFYSFNGKQYSCNPKCISDKLQSHDDIEIVWAFKNPREFVSELPSNIKTVKYRSPKYYFFAKTSKIIVFNVQGYGELARRKEQIFIQTWHASNGYKKVGNYTGIARKVNLMGHKDYSYVMSGTESMIKRRIHGSMEFYGEIIKGTPRIDSIINQDMIGMKEKVYGYLNIPLNKRLLLYAPTWRKNRKRNDYGLEYELLKKSIEERFGGEWIIAIRFHPNVHTKIKANLPYLIDATGYPDMEDLIYVADVMISDYSSCIWDYSFTYRPCFIFCVDLDDYISVSNFDIPIETWGFPICKTMDELSHAILSFDQDSFKKSMEKHHCDMGSLEDGKATKRVCRLIIHTIKEIYKK